MKPRVGASVLDCPLKLYYVRGQSGRPVPTRCRQQNRAINSNYGVDNIGILKYNTSVFAPVAELADAYGSGPYFLIGVQVRFLSGVPTKTPTAFTVGVLLFNKSYLRTFRFIILTVLLYSLYNDFYYIIST